MASVRFEQFTGMAPRVGTKRLPLGAAQDAIDIGFKAGRIVPQRGYGYRRLGELPANTQSYYQKGLVGLTSPSIVDYVESPVRDDTHNRIFLCTQGGTHLTFAATNGFAGYNTSLDISANPSMPSLVYNVGLPAPSSAPTLNLGTYTGTADVSAVSYVYTVVDHHGVESAPSPPSNVTERHDGQVVTVVTGLGTYTNYAMGATAKKRYYRTATGASSTEFFFVGEGQYSSTNFQDFTVDAELGEPLQTEGHLPPPTNLRSLCAHPQGFLIAHKDNLICFSEPYLPNAWNPDNQLSTEYDIIGIRPSASGIVVCTERHTYLMSGNSPSTMDLTLIETDYPCVAGRTMAEIDGSVLYAAAEGIVAVTGNQAQLITKELLDKATFEEVFQTPPYRNLDRSDWWAVGFDGKYIMYYVNRVTTNDAIPLPVSIYAKGGIVLDLKENAYSKLSTYYRSAHIPADDKELRLVADSEVDNANYAIWDYGWDTTAGTHQALSDLNYQWTSGDLRLHDQILFAWMKVEFDDADDVTVEIRIDDVIVFTKVVSDVEPFRLPSNLRGDYFNVKLSGVAVVESVVLADTIEELEP